MTPRGPRQLDSEDELYAAAVAALARRSHSAFEMRKYLERRAADRELAPKVLGRLKSEELIDDARYATLFARARSVNRRQGPLRIARELRARGVADRHIQAALGSVASPEGERAALRRRIEIWLRQHGRNGAGSLNRKQMASLYRSLLRAGFPGGMIHSEINRRGGDPMPGSTEPEFEDA